MHKNAGALAVRLALVGMAIVASGCGDDDTGGGSGSGSGTGGSGSGPGATSGTPSSAAGTGGGAQGCDGSGTVYKSCVDAPQGTPEQCLEIFDAVAQPLIDACEGDGEGMVSSRPCDHGGNGGCARLVGTACSIVWDYDASNPDGVQAVCEMSGGTFLPPE